MLEMLDDDSLCEVFRFLRLSDQVRMATVCERFHMLLLERFWRRKLNNFTTKGDKGFDRLNNDEYQTLFRLMTPYMQELTIHNTASLVFTSYLGRYTARPELAFYLHFDYPNLQVLRCYDQTLHGAHLATWARKCPQLRSLSVSSSYINGEHIVEFRHLRELYVHSTNLDSQYVSKILRMSLLTRVHLSGNVTDKPAIETALSALLPQIVELRAYDDEAHIVSGDFFCKNAASLRSLRTLYCKEPTNFVYELENLRELHIDSRVDLGDLKKVILKNLHLEQVYLALNLARYAMCQLWVSRLAEQLHKQRRAQSLTIYFDYPPPKTQHMQLLVNESCPDGKVPIIVKTLPCNRSNSPILVIKVGIEYALTTKC